MNRFGASSYLIPLVDPFEVRASRTRFRRDAIPALALVNSLYIPAGVWPARGWILLPRYQYNEIDKYSTSLNLEVDDPLKADNIGILKNISIVQAQCVTRGLATDDNAVYLVEITDGRGIVSNKWFKFPLATQYNIRSPAYPQTFHPSSMNSGTTWTWATMLEDIWGHMSTILGPWPGLPYAPTGTPEGFWFLGVPAWNALCNVLDHLGLQVACDLTQDQPYSIVKIGAVDSAFNTLTEAYSKRLEDDLEWIDVGAARIPRVVTVYFRRRNSIYGTEETIYYGNDDIAKQWSMATLHGISVDAPSEYSSAVGEHHLWSDFTIRYDDSSNPLDADLTVANAIAQERVTQYFDRINPERYMTRTYTGALPFVTGSRVSGVCYYHDYRNGRHGWRTKIVNGDLPPFAEVA